MTHRRQLSLNARCLRRALVDGDWQKVPHFHRGLCRAALRHDRIGNVVSYLWPVAALGALTALVVMRLF